MPDLRPEEPAQTVLTVSDSDEESAEVSVRPWDAVSQEELRALETRARARMADPEYLRRVKATDDLARRLLDGEL